MMGKIQSKSSSAGACANAFAASAAGLTAISEVSKDSSSHYVGNPLVHDLLVSEADLTARIASQVTQFVGHVHSTHHEFEALDQHLHQEIKQTSAQLNSWQKLGREAK